MAGHYVQYPAVFPPAKAASRCLLPLVVPVEAAMLAGTGGSAAATTVVHVNIAVNMAYRAGADDAMLL